MNSNRFSKRQTPPIVPQSAAGWLMPLGKLMWGALIVAVCSLGYVVGRQVHVLADAARNH